MADFVHNDITGTTESRLGEVMSYNVADPYPIGVVDGTGILSKVGDLITYQIEYITYVTDVVSRYTYFILNYNEARAETNNFEEQNIVRDESDGTLLEPLKVTSDLNIERQEESIFDRHHKMGQIKTLSELINFGNGYFQMS